VEQRGFPCISKGDGPVTKGSLQVIVETKQRQAAKIRELGHALVDAGFLTLDEQSKALGLARSTSWTILRARHKSSGLSAAIIKRMLLSPQLPPLARRKVLEYTTDKLAGVYGGSRMQRLKFFEHVRATPKERRRLELDSSKSAGRVQRVKRKQLI
jgi:hypothetical protein